MFCLRTDCTLAILGFVWVCASLIQNPIEVWESLAKVFPPDVGCIRRVQNQSRLAFL